MTEQWYNAHVTVECRSCHHHHVVIGSGGPVPLARPDGLLSIPSACPKCKCKGMYIPGEPEPEKPKITEDAFMDGFPLLSTVKLGTIAAAATKELASRFSVESP